jgi:hypothetical protein
MVFKDFIGQAYTSLSVNVAAQECVNLYPEVVEVGGEKNVKALYGTPGLHDFASPAAVVRGMWSGAGRLFVAAGAAFIEYSSSGGSVSSHAIPNDTFPVYIFSNGNQLMVITSGLVYCDNGAGPVAVNYTGTSDPVKAWRGAFMDGYFIIAERVGSTPPDSRKIFISSINDGTKWDALDFALKEAYPDVIMSLLADPPNLWIFGGQTSEIWRNTGNADFPFERAAFIRLGCVAPDSPVSMGGYVYWLGADDRGGTVAYRARGIAPERVSTHAVEQAWRVANVSTAGAICYSYNENGHYFYVVTFRGNSTWVYDATSETWHARTSVISGSRLNHRGLFHEFIPEWGANGKHIVSDYLAAKLYEMSLDFYDDAGTDTVRVRSATHLCNEQRRNFHHRFQLDIESGASLNAQPEQNAYLDWSDDGGHTFNTPRAAGIGLYQNFKKRVVWRRLGAARDRVYRVTITGKTKVALVNAYLNITPGNA